MQHQTDSSNIKDNSNYFRRYRHEKRYRIEMADCDENERHQFDQTGKNSRLARKSNIKLAQWSLQTISSQCHQVMQSHLKDDWQKL